MRFQDRCFELFRRDDPPPISLRGPAVSGSLEGRADAVVTEAERITAMAIGQWRVENRRDQESVGVDADEPGQREDPLVRHGLVVCRPVLGIRRGKERIPLRLDHRPGDVEAGCQSRKAVGAEQGLGEDGGHCQVVGLVAQQSERQVAGLGPGRDCAPPGRVIAAVVRPALGASRLVAEIADG